MSVTAADAASPLLLSRVGSGLLKLVGETQIPVECSACAAMSLSGESQRLAAPTPRAYSAPYAPEREHTIRAPGPAVGHPMAHYPGDLVLSERDANAPTLDDIPSAGVLPTWHDTRAYVDNLLKAAKSA